MIGWIVTMILSLAWLFEAKAPTMMFIFGGGLVSLFVGISRMGLDNVGLFLFGLISIVSLILVMFVGRINQL